MRQRNANGFARKLLLLITVLSEFACSAPDAATNTAQPAGVSAAGTGVAPTQTFAAAGSAAPASTAAGSSLGGAGTGSGSSSTNPAANQSGNAGSPTVAPTAPTGSLPCEVAGVVSARCQSCHAAQLHLGAPMPLVTPADFQRPAVSDPTHKVYELVARRIADATNPMPPLSAGMLSAAERTTLTAWTAGGAQAASASGAACAPVATTDPNPPATTDPVADDKDVVCYDLTVHDKSSPTDTTPFQIPTGESYHCFYFDVPWAAPSLSVAFRSKLDNDKALHHWFLYAMPSAHPNGTVETCLPLHLDDPQMIAGWAPGGKDMTMPAGVGAEIPKPGSTLMLEWHYFNSGSAPISDQSKVNICTVPVGSRPNVASITWTGTEDFGVGMPPGMTSSFTGTCTPSRRGVTGSDPIHILYTIPHMHKYGRHMKLEIARASGEKVAMFDQPFSESNQAWVATPAEMLMGDKLLTTCTFQNTSDSNVAYGSPFGNGEMCYAFVLHYPAHALDNGGASLLGASNSCL